MRTTIARRTKTGTLAFGGTNFRELDDHWLHLPLEASSVEKQRYTCKDNQSRSNACKMPEINDSRFRQSLLVLAEMA